MSDTDSSAAAAAEAAAEGRKPRRLRGHKKGAVTCCVASSSRPGVVASSGEDGCLCWFDLRTKDVLFTMEATNQPISSMCFKAGNEDLVYASAGNEILSFDVRMIAVSSKGFLAAADDSGDVKNGSSGGQCFNPPFVHSIAVSEEGILGGSYKVCAVARGDGAVDVVDLEYELAPAKSKGLPRMADLSLSSKRTDIGDGCGSQSQGKRIHLDYTVGGHTSSVSCVTFSAFGEKGKFLVSGGNDSSIKLWDWSKGFSSETNSSAELVLDIKVNWLCTTPTDSDNLILCDTSKVVKVYNLP
uniref:Uncharacterized protein n=1 Tax=Oryza nivara TaxID=4536 RepID=A0A0E0FIA3_ORYNI